ncbi:MAG TPA: hypothetical protein VFY35_03920 [Burkholderiaceae bacterium]|nr:hypothetical protein [Burkholderiaceae bacterium]
MEGQLSIQRVGGMLPTLRPWRVHPLHSLNAPQLASVQQLFEDTRQPAPAPHPEAMCYVLELTTPQGVQKTTLGFSELPPGLHPLLP